MDGLLTITGIIIIVFGILQIILFFKMWGMTNDIKEMRKKTCSQYTADHPFLKTLIITGEYDEAYRILHRSFATEVQNLYTEASHYTAPAIDNNETRYSKSYKEIVSKYAKQIEKLKGHSIDFEKYDSFDKAKALLSA